MAEPAMPEHVPPSDEILRRLRALDVSPLSVTLPATMAVDPERLRGDLETLAGAMAQIRALIRPPRDLPPALHRIPILRLGPIRRLLLRSFEILFRRQMLINDGIVTSLEAVRQVITRIVPAPDTRR